MRLSLFSLSGGEAILTGAQPGRQMFGRLVATVAGPAEPVPGYLDFEDITVATASFLRESVIAFRDYARSTLPNLYPVIANASASVTEELEFFLKHRKDAFWACSLSPEDVPTETCVLGQLDDAHRSTLDLVVQLGAATAPDLAAKGQAGLSPTAWNNRLSFLVSRGLLIERRVGKMKVFNPVLGARDGN